MEKINCIIIEDKISDAEYLKSLISKYDSLVLKAHFANPLESSSYIKENRPELIFMDIEMPVMNGMDFFRQLEPSPICIFVTAYSEYAWEGFEAHAFDFILKPAKPDRFAICMERLATYLELRKRSDVFESQIETNTVVVKQGSDRHVIRVTDILYIEALKDYSRVVTRDRKLMTLSKLKHFLEKLPTNQFTRIHRSYAIAVDKVNKVETNDLYVQDIKLPIGKTYKHNLKLFI